MIIRQEREKDHDEVYSLVKRAFESAEHSDGNEQDLVNELRKGSAFVPELSLVAEKDGRLAGYILFTEGKVGSDRVLVLAPLAVLPEYQKQGIGTALIKEGHKIAGQMGYGYSIVLGSETYYPRVGYVPASVFGIEIPHGMPENNFMAVKLRDDAKAVRGAVTYAEEFGI